jgi:UDP-N-acetyl-2-amino-2-deoxyglucuronate dehydrogenase
MDESPIKFALIGCGRIAPRHAEQMVKYGKLIAVCDAAIEKADALAEQYNTNAYYNIDELLAAEKNLSIVSVCTPNGLHAEHAMKALQAGKHVLCEKPLSISSSSAKEMMTASVKNNRKLFVVKSTRYNPYLQSLKKVLDENKQGTIYSFQLNCFWNRPPAYYANSWRGTKELDGGTLFTQFSHYIDALLWLLGDVKTVTGVMKNAAHKKSIEFEDTGVATLQMESGIIGGLNWSVNTFAKNMEVSLTLIAEKGTVKISGEYMNILEYEATEGFSLQQTGTANAANDYGFYKGSMSNHDKVYENMMLALKDDRHPFTYADDGLKTVETIEKIYNSVSLL